MKTKLQYGIQFLPSAEIVKNIIFKKCTDLVMYSNDENRKIVPQEVIFGICAIIALTEDTEFLATKRYNLSADYVKSLKARVNIYGENIENYFKQSRYELSSMSNEELIIYLACIAMGNDKKGDMLVPIRTYTKQAVIDGVLEYMDENIDYKIFDNDDTVQKIVDEFIDNEISIDSSLSNSQINQIILRIMRVIRHRYRLSKSVLQKVNEHKLSGYFHGIHKYFRFSHALRSMISKIKYITTILGVITGSIIELADGLQLADFFFAMISGAIGYKIGTIIEKYLYILPKEIKKSLTKIVSNIKVRNHDENVERKEYERSKNSNSFKEKKEDIENEISRMKQIEEKDKERIEEIRKVMYGLQNNINQLERTNFSLYQLSDKNWRFKANKIGLGQLEKILDMPLTDSKQLKFDSDGMIVGGISDESVKKVFTHENVALEHNINTVKSNINIG